MNKQPLRNGLLLDGRLNHHDARLVQTWFLGGDSESSHVMANNRCWGLEVFDPEGQLDNPWKKLWRGIVDRQDLFPGNILYKCILYKE